MLRLLLTLTLLATGCAHPAAAATGPRPAVSTRAAAPALTGIWRMALHVEDKVFQDELTLRRDPSGALTGTLTVPGNFSASLEHVKIDGDRLTFEIMAPEGAKPYRVRYVGLIGPKGKAMAGFATLDDGTLMGSFVADRR